MNLPQALVAKRHAELTAEQARLQGFREGVAKVRGYKLNQFFHDCLPGCKPDSSDRKDHVPLPGNPVPTCRVLYVRHLRFMAAGATHTERLFLAANRCGKSEAAAFEMRCHLTGRYPEWWQGRRFPGPIQAWAAGDTRQTTRDIIQVALFGPYDGVKTGVFNGMIEPDRIAKFTRSTGGVSDCLDTVYVKHESGGLSELQLKSYDQGRRVFQGTRKHLVWL